MDKNIRNLSFEEGKILRAFFVMDIQTQEEWANIIYEQLRLIKQKKQSHWRMSMNAYELYMSEDNVKISPLFDEYDETQITLSLQQFEYELVNWIRLIKNT
ncbi:hypothetical protein FLL45_00235 [Aliikangiella marina]|uniref:Uncharacterized protein n=1 Tax=Aliikangiella marina TaxID=1712262 RepID=A0A545TH19_9GAMM|nr:hypothetical protein [Aliikangiella marina]TQV76431.1 hypothetical protein FLL45_00235 [Aliikangiella marina]